MPVGGHTPHQSGYTVCAHAAPVRRKGHTLVEDVGPRGGAESGGGPRTEAARSDAVRQPQAETGAWDGTTVGGYPALASAWPGMTYARAAHRTA